MKHLIESSFTISYTTCPDSQGKLHGQPTVRVLAIKAMREEVKSKILISSFLGMVLFGLGFILYFGTPARPVSLLPLAVFESAPAVVEAILLNSGKEIENAQVLLIGYQAEKPQQVEIVRQLLKAKNPEVLVFESNMELADEYPKAERMKLSEQLDVLAKGLREALKQKQTVVLITPAVYSAGIVSGSVADLLRNRYTLPIQSLTMIEFPRRRDQEKEMAIACLMKDADKTGTGALGCALLQTGRAHYQKKMQSDSQIAFTGILESRGPGDFYFYVN